MRGPRVVYQPGLLVHIPRSQWAHAPFKMSVRNGVLTEAFDYPRAVAFLSKRLRVRKFKIFRIKSICFLLVLTVNRCKIECQQGSEPAQSVGYFVLHE